jgi:hypothetical protein
MWACFASGGWKAFITAGDNTGPAEVLVRDDIGLSILRNLLIERMLCEKA